MDRLPSGTPKKPLDYTDFLNTVKVVRMLYGRDAAKKYLTDNLGVYYNLDNA